jgi:hypothetical protein
MISTAALEEMVVELKRLISDPRLDVGATLRTVDFVDVNGDTEVRLRHEGFPTPEHCDNHNYGWSASLEKLEKLFRNKQK